MDNNEVSKDIIRVSQALGFLLSLDENHKMERLKLIKILWAADRFNIRRYGRTITGTSYVAMAHGPVCSLALDIARINKDNITFTEKDYRYLEEHFTSDSVDTSMQKSPGEDSLSDTDKESMRWAWGKFKDVDSFELADKISHEYPEWKEFENYFKENRSSQLIDQTNFFKNPEKDDYFKEDDETLALAQEQFNEECALDKELSLAFGA